ncbi:hypothetical protein RUM43_008085 [Polyplax serrata]|uniref:Uncharacterized protein n=1 Tax=Polyplax serrata TaxID=468196 RepID=A0AAN8S5Y2_POLSC
MVRWWGRCGCQELVKEPRDCHIWRSWREEDEGNAVDESSKSGIRSNVGQVLEEMRIVRIELNRCSRFRYANTMNLFLTSNHNRYQRQFSGIQLRMKVLRCKVRCQAFVEQEFTPTVTATCKAGYMTIKVATNQSFYGTIHSRDYRTPGCMSYGNGTHLTMLGINLLAPPGSPDNCGVFINNVSYF